MTLTDSVRFSIAHSNWALAQLLAHSRRLSNDQFNQDFGIGPGSLRVNIFHVIEAMFFFADCFAQRQWTERPTLHSDSGSIDGLSRLLDQATRDLRDAMTSAIARGLPASIVWESAPSGRAAPAVAIAQVFDHATLHRTQCINMFKRLGVSPLPDLDPLSFEAAGIPW